MRGQTELDIDGRPIAPRGVELGRYLTEAEARETLPKHRQLWPYSELLIAFGDDPERPWRVIAIPPE